MFFQFVREYLDFYIELSDHAKYHVIGVGIVKFHRESGKPLLVEDVLYVPGMTKNLISISTLEDKGYIVTFERGKFYIHPKDSKVAKVIGVRYGSLF